MQSVTEVCFIREYVMWKGRKPICTCSFLWTCLRTLFNTDHFFLLVNVCSSDTCLKKEFLVTSLVSVVKL